MVSELMQQMAMSLTWASCPPSGRWSTQGKARAQTQPTELHNLHLLVLRHCVHAPIPGHSINSS